MQCSNKLAVIIWMRFGPYHIARLKAASKIMREAGYDTIGLEIVGTDNTYAWNKVTDRSGTKTFTLLPDSEPDIINRIKICSLLRAWLNKHKPAVVAISGWATLHSLCALAWCNSHGIPSILMSESKEDDHPRNSIIESIKSIIARRFSAAVVGGHAHLDYASKLGIPACKIFKGYDVVDNDYFAKGALLARAEPARRRTELGLPDRYFLSVSRFIPEKNLSRLITAYKAFSASVPHDKKLPLVICGSGKLEKRLKETADCDPCIHWMGFRQVEDLPSIYGLASAFIIPSTVEPWGLVVNEAMACGLPVLCSKTVGAGHELVREGLNGFIFDPRNVQEIVDCMIKFAMLDPASRESMSAESLRTIAQWHPEQFANAMLKAVIASRQK